MTSRASHSDASHPGKVFFAGEPARALLEDHLAELSHPSEDAGWEHIKRNDSRTVWRKEIEGRQIYLKHFHSRALTHRIGRRLGFSDACFEMRFSNYLSQRGVETPPALAAVCRNGTEWLATFGVRPSEPAHEWHARQRRRGAEGQRRIREATAALGRAVGRMHATGVIHGDLHAGNVLIRTDGERPRPVLMDLHRMRRRRRLSRRARVANLAQLLHDRADDTTRTDRLRFLKHYLAAGETSGTLRGWQSMVEQFARRHRRRMYARRDRRTLGDNAYFAPISLGNHWRGHVVRRSKRRPPGSQACRLSFTVEQWRDAIGDTATLLDGGDGVTVLKDSRSGRVVRRNLKVGPHVLDVVVKRPRRKRPWKLLPDCFRESRVMRAFRLGHALLTRRIATALPLAALERRVGPLLLESILITEAVDAPQLHAFLHDYLSEPPASGATLTPVERRHLAQDVLWQMGRLLQRLHDNNFHHRDLKGPNMLVHWRGGESPEIVLLDLDGLRTVRHLSEKRRCQGLMRLNVSLLRCPAVNHAGQLRMLLGYLRRPGSGRINFKPYWRVLEQWSARKLRQQIRSRRKRQKAVRR